MNTNGTARLHGRLVLIGWLGGRPQATEPIEAARVWATGCGGRSGEVVSRVRGGRLTRNVESYSKGRRTPSNTRRLPHRHRRYPRFTARWSSPLGAGRAVVAFLDRLACRPCDRCLTRPGD